MVYPLPFRDRINFDFYASGSDQVVIELFAMSGIKVCSAVSGEQQEQQRHVTMDAGNLPAGIYFYRIVDGDRVKTGRVIKMP
jgi:hypothetical protein